MTTVREATAGDAEAVVEVLVTAAERYGPGAYDEEQVDAWTTRPAGEERVRERVDDEDVHVVVAERAPEEGAPPAVAGVGHLQFPGHEDDPDRGEVVAVYVHADHARAGVGSTLLAHLEERARDAGLRELELWSSLNAVGFYERHGYERRREESLEMDDGVELAVVVMEKALR